MEKSSHAQSWGGLLLFVAMELMLSEHNHKPKNSGCNPHFLVDYRRLTMTRHKLGPFWCHFSLVNIPSGANRLVTKNGTAAESGFWDEDWCSATTQRLHNLLFDINK